MSKHPDPQDQPVKGPDDLERNPGIGQGGKLNRREGLDGVEGDSTVVGDTANNVQSDGSIDPDDRGRALALPIADLQRSAGSPPRSSPDTPRYAPPNPTEHTLAATPGRGFQHRIQP